MKTPLSNSPIAILRREHYPTLRFRTDQLKLAGKILAKQGEQAALEYLRERGSVEAPANAQPPAKCHVIALSRPLNEWPIYQDSEIIQKHIYQQSHAEFLASKPETDKESIKAWFKTQGVKVEFENVQGLNKIFNNARSTYEGVITKVENRNEKKLKRLERQNRKRAASGQELLESEVETALNEAGYLNHPPGLNPSVFCYQQVSPKPYVPGTILGVAYTRNPSDPIVRPVQDRLSIPKGQPGYVPPYHRDNLSTKKHRRIRFSGGEPLLAVIRIQDDWALIDVRGLLRNAQWRDLIPAGEPPTIQSLLDLMTGDPVLSIVNKPGKPTQTIASFLYKPGIVQVVKAKPRKGGFVQKLLAGTTQSVSVVGIDLGVNNLIAAKLFRIDPQQQPEHLQSYTLSEPLVQDFRHLRGKCDKNEADLLKYAIEQLPASQQAEIHDNDNFGSEQAKAAVCQHLGLDPQLVPWETMNRNSHILTDMALANGMGPAFCTFPYKEKGKKGKVEIRKTWDKTWAKKLRPQLSRETRTNLNEALWEAKRTSPQYNKLAVRKKELARRCVNYVVEVAEKRAQCGKVIIAIEDLNVRFFHGRGTAATKGWLGFFTYKKEGRWFMQAIHKAFSELATHRGHIVIEVCPHYTSQACPQCRYCDASNRGDPKNREAFACVACGYRGNADIDVAAHNIALVAITGESIKKSSDPVPPEQKEVLAAE